MGLHHRLGRRYLLEWHSVESGWVQRFALLRSCEHEHSHGHGDGQPRSERLGPSEDHGRPVPNPATLTPTAYDLRLAARDGVGCRVAVGTALALGPGAVALLTPRARAGRSSAAPECAPHAGGACRPRGD